MSSKEINRLVNSKDSEIENLKKRIESSELELTRVRNHSESVQRKLNDRDLEVKRTNDEYDHIKTKNETLQKVI